MRVCLDGTAFENNRQRGVQRYLRGVVDHSPTDVQVQVLIAKAACVQLPTRAGVTALSPGLLRMLPRQVRAKLAAGPRRRAESTADVFHASYYTLPTT
jgi:hypothetical protein